MFLNSNPIDEENVKNLQKISNELEKAFGDFLKLHPEMAATAIVASIDRLTTVLHNDMEDIKGILSGLKKD